MKRQPMVKQFATHLPSREARRIEQIAEQDKCSAASVVRRLVCKALAPHPAEESQGVTQ